MGWWSRYAHLCETGHPAGAVAQGAWVGDVGNTGKVFPLPPVRCGSSPNGAHLHFEVHDPYTTADATLSGVTISHLDDEYDTAHQSDNAGAGYTDYRARDDAFHARALATDIGPASTRRGKFNTCGAETRYVYPCVNLYFTIRAQDFIAPRSPGTGLHETFSLVQQPDGNVVKVRGVIQKAYASKLTVGGARVSAVLGRPLGEEGTFSGAPFQGFENGTIMVGPGQCCPEKFTVAAIDGGGTTILQRTLRRFAGAGDCASVTDDLAVNIIDVQQISAHFGPDGSPAYDSLYDYWSGDGTAGYTDGAVNVLELQAIAPLSNPPTTCPPEL